MRWIASILFALLFAVLVADAARANDFPYQATVAGTGITARSGPSFGTYPTERLTKFSQVEVHQEGPNGWVAIRPPQGAFDWIPAGVVKRLDGDLAEVTASDAAGWIGSNVKKVDKHVSQVQLKPGERVQILAEREIVRADGSKEAWLKIAPPTGEFRWVQSKHLSLKSPEQLAHEETAERLAREERWRRENAESGGGVLALLNRDRGEESSPQVASRESEVEQAQFFQRPRRPLFPRREEIRNQSEGDEVEPLVIDRGEPSDSPEEAGPASSPRSRDVPREYERKGPRVSLDPQSFAANDRSEKPATPMASSTPKNPPIDAEHFHALLEQLEVDLTVMVAQDAAKWSLTSLRARAEALVEDGPTPLDRGRARLVLDRIAEFESTLPPGHEEPLTFPTRLPEQPAEAIARPEFATKYDAVGYLMPVLTTKPGYPPYQLTDKDGNTLQYVSPAPGVNLNRYVKKQVGVYGQRGYLESLKKQHITVSSVVDLDRHRR